MCVQCFTQKRAWAKGPTCLVERRAMTSIGGAILTVNAFSRNFHVMGTLFSKQMWETNRWANSVDGKTTPAELRLELSWIAQSRGSLFFSCADLVSWRTESQRVGWFGCRETAISVLVKSTEVLYLGMLRRGIHGEQQRKRRKCWRQNKERARERESLLLSPFVYRRTELEPSVWEISPMA